MKHYSKKSLQDQLQAKIKALEETVTIHKKKTASTSKIQETKANLISENKSLKKQLKDTAAADEVNKYKTLSENRLKEIERLKNQDHSQNQYINNLKDELFQSQNELVQQKTQLESSFNEKYKTMSEECNNHMQEIFQG